MRLLYLVLPGLLAACSQPATHSESAASAAGRPPEYQPVPAPAPVPSPPAPGPAVAEAGDTFVPGWAPPTSADTLLRLQGRAYGLRIQSANDSTRKLTTTYEPTPGHPERARGYEGIYTFTLTDSAGGRVFRRELRKAAFFKVGFKDVITESEAFAPEYLGYSPAFGALVFSLRFMAPESDIGGDVLLLLDTKGNVLRVSEGAAVGGPEVAVGLSGDGQALLTGSEVLRPGRPALSLQKPDADLVGAFFLTDTTLLTVYSPGKSHSHQLPDGSYTYGSNPTPQQLRAPNAVVRHTRNGRVLCRFRYQGYREELGFVIPSEFLRATGTYYLLDKGGLRLLPRTAPAQTTELKFAAMTPFAAPQKPAEVRVELHSLEHEYAFYVDTLQPRHIRYQRQKH